MGKPSRDKGVRFERTIVKLLKAMGFHAERIPLSGAVKGSFSDDVIAEIDGDIWRFELKKKARGDGFAMLYRWLEPESTDALIIAADRKEPLLVIPLSELPRLTCGVSLKTLVAIPRKYTAQEIERHFKNIGKRIPRTLKILAEADREHLVGRKLEGGE